MSTQTFSKIAFFFLLLGWLILLYICITLSNVDEPYMLITLIGVLFCTLGVMLFIPVLYDDVLFKKVDELEEEKRKYFEARRRLEIKILDL